jgi:type I restriction enzyme, S subunit
MGNIQDGKVVFDDLKYVDAVPLELMLRPGDLLFNRTNSLDLIGKVGLFDLTADAPMSFASYLVRLRTTNDAEPKYLAYLLNTPGVLGIARANALVAIGQCNLNPTRYGEIRIVVPPLPEQQNIIAYLDRQTGKIDALISAADAGITLLEERRSVLISTAVTGKIDVRGLVPVKAEAA